MGKDKGYLIDKDELLWDVALRGIGIQLPDEYILRFTKLLQVIDKKTLEAVTLSDFTDIETTVRGMMKSRIANDDANY